MIIHFIYHSNFVYLVYFKCTLKHILDANEFYWESLFPMYLKGTVKQNGSQTNLYQLSKQGK